MGQIVLTNAQVFLGGCNFSGDLNQVGLNVSIAMLNDTVFGDTFESNRAGLQKVSVDMTGFWNALAGNPDGSDNTAFANLGVDDRLLTMFADGITEGTSTDTGYALLTTQSDYSPFSGAKVGELLPFKLKAEGRGTLLRVVPLKNSSAVMNTVTGNGTKFNVGAVSASQFLYAGLHVLEFQGTSPTLDVTIQSDADASAGGETTRITFTQVAGATGAQYAARVAGPMTDEWWRANWTIGGTSTPGFKFLIWCAIA